MTGIQVHFAIRLRSEEPFDAIQRRVERALGCSLTPSEDDYGEICAEGTALLVHLSLARWRFVDDPRLWVYSLKGDSVTEQRWLIETRIDLTEWMAAELRERDSPDWYVATREEMLKEAGLA